MGMCDQQLQFCLFLARLFVLAEPVDSKALNDPFLLGPASLKAWG